MFAFFTSFGRAIHWPQQATHFGFSTKILIHQPQNTRTRRRQARMRRTHTFTRSRSNTLRLFRRRRKGSSSAGFACSLHTYAAGQKAATTTTTATTMERWPQNSVSKSVFLAVVSPLRTVFFLCSTFSQHLRTKFQISPQTIIHFFLQFNYLRLSTQNNEKALHRGSQEAKGKLFIFPMLPIFPPLPTAVRGTFGRLHASSPNFYTPQYNPLPGAQYSDSLFTHWKR